MPLGTEAVAGVSASVGPVTRHVHAFGADALGDLDAVALVDALRTGKVSRPELVEAAIARTQAVNPDLNGLAHENFDQALAPAPTRTSGRAISRVPTFFKDNVDVEGMPTCRAPTPGTPNRRPTASSPGCSWRPASCRWARPRCRSSASVPRRNIRGSARCATLGHRLHRRRVVVGFGGVRRRRVVPIARERRRRVDPNSGRLQRLVGLKPSRGRLPSGLVAAARCRWIVTNGCSHPVGARHRGVLP